MSLSHFIPTFRKFPSFAANLHQRAPFLASIELSFEFTTCATRQASEPRSLVQLYPKVPYMLLQHDMNPCYSKLLTSKQPDYRYTPLYPAYTRYTRVGNANYALAVSRYIGLRSRYFNQNIKISVDFQQQQVKLHSNQCHNIHISVITDIVVSCKEFFKNKKCCQNFLLSIYSRNTGSANQFVEYFRFDGFSRS